MREPIPTPQQGVLQQVKELLQQQRAETMKAIADVVRRIDEMEVQPQVDQARWDRREALALATSLHRSPDGVIAAESTDAIVATAKAFEAFMKGEPEA